MAEERKGAGPGCPICGAPGVERYRPFCSRRCADIDLGRWLNGGYSVPVVELDESDFDELESDLDNDGSSRDSD